MNRVLLLFAFLVLSTSSIFAQIPGSIGIFADPAGMDSYIEDQTPGLVNAYVVHVFSSGATASQFKVTWSADMLMSYLAEKVTDPYIGIGTATSGIAIAYGLCIASPNMILTISFFAQGLSGECAEFRVVEDPATSPPGIYVTDCADPPHLLNSTGGLAYVNPGPACTNKVENSTWGNIKSLFR
jgi:hypothetical protein